MGYALVNLALLLSTMFLFLRLLRLSGTGFAPGMEVLFSIVVLGANDVTKLFFMSPHTQLYNLFVPVVTVFLLFRLLESGGALSARAAALLGAALGIGMLAYGSFAVSIVCVGAVQVLAYRKILPAAIVGGTVALIYVAWVLFVRQTAGFFYSYETEMYRQFVWLVDCARSGAEACVPRLQEEARVFFNTLAVLTVVPLALLFAVRLARYRWPEENSVGPVKRELPVAVGLTLVASGMLLLAMGGAGYMPRLYWILIPPMLLILAVELQRLRVALPPARQWALSGIVFGATLVHLAILASRQGPYR